MLQTFHPITLDSFFFGNTLSKSTWTELCLGCKFCLFLTPWWPVYTRQNSAFCAIFWYFLVQNLRTIVPKIPAEWKIFWTIFLCFLCIYVFSHQIWHRKGTKFAQNFWQRFFWFLAQNWHRKRTNLAQNFWHAPDFVPKSPNCFETF